MISDARGGHVSPGIYTEERDVTYSVKSLGITSLGLAGETLKGPAFQPIAIKDWAEFVTYFGGTSSAKFKGNNLPKYELPYIAKEYLKESRNLTVCRTLGLSGHKNSKAYVVYTEIFDGTSDVAYPLAVFRSKIKDYAQGNGSTCVKGKNETFKPIVSSFDIKPYSGTTYNASCQQISGTPDSFPLVGYILNDELNAPGAYICEERLCKESGVTNNVYVLQDNKMVLSAVTSGQVYYEATEKLNKFALEFKYDDDEKIDIANVSLDSNSRDYILNVYSVDPKSGTHCAFIEALYDYSFEAIVEREEYAGRQIIFKPTKYQEDGDEYNSFREPFRPAETPWIVSEVVASTERADMKRLFKFFTISDGNAANYQVKISIQNVRPDEGLFDVLVRDFYDTDSAPVVLERYSNCSLIKGAANYIGLMIGTYDGEFEMKSKYITIELNNDEVIEGSVPCGFLGYPIPTYGLNHHPYIKYNRDIDSEVRLKRQFFGLGKGNLDEDILNYKGKNAYNNNEGDFDADLLTNGFHLDSILSEEVQKENKLVVYVDGVSGFTFTAVNPETGRDNGSIGKIPRIVTEDYAEETIYEDKTARKFTMYMYGGFDGWDIFRNKRTNTDDYKATRYQDAVSATDKEGLFKIEGATYKELNSQLDLKLPANAIASDYYAYLGAYNQFANPEDVDINIFATPGIDWKNNTLLVDDVINIIEDSDGGRGGDAIYVVTTPQYSDNEASQVYEPQELVNDLEDTSIDSSYVATYWPWVKIYDADDKLFVNLPATKDVVRNMAFTDNNKYPWFSPAGTSRGKVECEKAVLKTDLNAEDVLYEGMINPIKTFAKDGVLVWGNKTLYSQDTPLNRVNVRRLMLRVKKLVVSASKQLIFDQYDQTLEKQFKNIVEPILSDVKKNRGLHDYRVIAECTPETRDQHILPAKILVKPVQALEYISISFVVTPESVEFTDEM